MSITVSGILISGTGEVLSGSDIILESLKTTPEVLKGIVGVYKSLDDGSYSFSCPIGDYNVYIHQPARMVKIMGVMSIASDSVDASLNSLIEVVNQDQITPEIVLQVMRLRDETINASDETKDLAAQLPTKEQFIDVQNGLSAVTADPANAVTEIFIPAIDFSLAINSASFGVISSRIAAWQFLHGIDASVTKVIDLPSHWSAMRISLIWSNLVANDGNVSFSGLIHSWAAGESFNVTPSGGGIVAAANPIPFVGSETRIELVYPIDATRHTTIRIGRNGTSANDTLQTAIAIIGVRLSKV